MKKPRQNETKGTAGRGNSMGNPIPGSQRHQSGRPDGAGDVDGDRADIDRGGFPRSDGLVGSDRHRRRIDGRGTQKGTGKSGTGQHCHCHQDVYSLHNRPSAFPSRVLVSAGSDRLK